MIRRTALAVLALAALACGKQTFLVAAFVQTPALPNPTDPSGTIPQIQVMTAYFGTIDTTQPTHIDASKEAPITDATASLSFHHLGAGGADASEDRIFDVPKASPAGTYALSSTDQPKLTFEVGVPYTLILQTAGADGEAYGARFTPAQPADIKQFQTSKCTFALPLGAGSYDAPRCLEGTASTDITIDRTDLPAAGQDPLPAFVLVGRFDPQKPAAQPQITYQTVPDSADKLLKYVLSDRDYRKTSFLIPGATAFPTPGFYIVSLLVVKEGKVSGNAFLGSTALSGTGAAGILHAQ